MRVLYLATVLACAVSSSSAYAHEPLDIRVEVTKFEEHAFTAIGGDEGIGYKTGLALTNNDARSKMVSIWPGDEFGFPMYDALFGIPGADCPLSSSDVSVNLPLGERVEVDICFVKSSNAEPHHVKITSSEGILLATITDQVNEDLCFGNSSHSHCIPAEFTGEMDVPKDTMLVLVAIGAGGVVVAVALARRRK